MEQLYKLCFIDATIVDQHERDRADSLEKCVARRYRHMVHVEDVEITDDRDGDWVDYAAAIRFVATPETLKQRVREVLDAEGRTIETWTVITSDGVRVLTEEDQDA